MKTLAHLKKWLCLKIHDHWASWRWKIWNQGILAWQFKRCLKKREAESEGIAVERAQAHEKDLN